MKLPAISIIMPVKNTEAFLRECLDSILEQSETNWELIAVDDHSTDSCLSILREYEQKDERIKILENNGVGIIKALRLAFAESKGRLITRMDSDDIMASEKLLILKSNLETFGKGYIAVGLVKYFSEKQLGEGFQRYEAWLNSLTSEGRNFQEIYKECVVPSPCWMVYREDLIACDAFEPNDYPEDYDLTFRFYLMKLKAIRCNTVLHYWRDYDTRTSRTDEHYADSTFFEIKYRYFIENEYDSHKNLVVWGAGAKGKNIAQRLLKSGIPFYWICDNPNKIGKHIYDQLLLPFDELSKIENPQSIITVAIPNAQQQIKKYLDGMGAQSMKDYFFFC